MRPVWPIPESEIDNVESKTIDYLSTLSNRYGDIEGYAKVKNEAISDFALRETYLLQYEYSAIRIVFTYYRNGNGWILNTFSWDEDFEATFKDTSQ